MAQAIETETVIAKSIRKKLQILKSNKLKRIKYKAQKDEATANSERNY